MNSFPTMIARLAARAPALVFVVAFAIGAAGLWLFFNDMTALDDERRLREDRSRIELRLADVQRRVEQLEVEATPAQERVMNAEKVIRELRQLTETWQWFGGNRAQQRANQERLKNMEALHADAVQQAGGLQQALRRAKWERDGHEIALGRIDAQLRIEQTRKQGAGYRLRQAWLGARSWIVLGCAAYLLVGAFTPVVWKRRHASTMKVAWRSDGGRLR